MPRPSASREAMRQPRSFSPPVPAPSRPWWCCTVAMASDGIIADGARELTGWGYITLLVDSFRPRGFATVCNHGMDVPPVAQAQDAFDAAAYLRGLPNVRADRIGVIGFSHGGWAV